MRCRLSLFGPPRLLDDQGKLISVPAKTHVLIAYLVLSSHGDPATRSSLRQLLWEDSDAKTAAANLRKFLSRVVDHQKQHGFELIRNRRDHVELSASSAWIDLVEFQRLISDSSPSDLTALCDIYRGDLLEGLEIDGSDLSGWVRLERIKLRDAFVSAVARRIDLATPDQDKVPRRIAARRLIEVDPYNEVAHRSLMRLYAEDGEPARVKDLYLSLEARLRADLGVAPNKTTMALYRSLLPESPMPSFASPLHAEASSAAAAPLAPGANHDALAPEDDSVVAAESSGVPRITVLPPPPVGAPDYGHHLASSLIEDVTIGLCRSKALSIIAPHTASQLSHNGRKSLFRKFNIDYAVETKLHNRAGELWLTVKLINAATRNIVWVDEYQFDAGQMSREYRELSRQIVLLLVDNVERAELARYETEQHPTAYHFYLTGQHSLRTLDLPHIRRARRAFKLAANSCPNFVPAISGLAQTFSMEWLLMARGDAELLEQARSLARRSLEIDPDDARGYRSLGLCHLYGGRFDESLQAFDHAEQRSPQHADLLIDFADALQHACQPAAALQKINHAVELNPLCPDGYWWTAGDVNFQLERYGDAIESMSRMRDQSPAYRLMAACWAMLGDKKTASEYMRKAKDIHPDFSVDAWLSIVPIRDPDFAQRYEHGLREAGFE